MKKRKLEALIKESLAPISKVFEDMPVAMWEGRDGSGMTRAVTKAGQEALDKLRESVKT